MGYVSDLINRIKKSKEDSEAAQNAAIASGATGLATNYSHSSNVTPTAVKPEALANGSQGATTSTYKPASVANIPSTDPSRSSARAMPGEGLKVSDYTPPYSNYTPEQKKNAVARRTSNGGSKYVYTPPANVDAGKLAYKYYDNPSRDVSHTQYSSVTKNLNQDAQDYLDAFRADYTEKSYEDWAIKYSGSTNLAHDANELKKKMSEMKPESSMDYIKLAEMEAEYDFLKAYDEHNQLMKYDVQSSYDTVNALDAQLDEVRKQKQSIIADDKYTMWQDANTTALNAEGEKLVKQFDDKIALLTQQRANLMTEANTVKAYQVEQYASNVKNMSDYEEYRKKGAASAKNRRVQKEDGNSARAKAYQAMTEEQAGVYDYLLGKYGKDKAEKYFDAIIDVLNESVGKKYVEELRENSASDFGYTAKADAFGLASGGANFVRNIGNDFVDIFTTPKYNSSWRDYAVEYIRDDLASMDKKELIAGKNISELSFDLAYNIGDNAIPIILGMIVGAGAGAAAGRAVQLGSFAGSVFEQSKKEAKLRGFDDKSANTYASLITMSETCLETLLSGIYKGSGITKLSERAVRNIGSVFWRAAAQVPIRMSGEFIEEGMQEYINPLIGNAILHDNNRITNETFQEALYSGVIGALTVLPHSTTTFVQTANTVKIGKYVNAFREVNGEAYDKFFNAALNSENKNIKEFAQNLESGKYVKSNGNIGELVVMMAGGGIHTKDAARALMIASAAKINEISETNIFNQANNNAQKQWDEMVALHPEAAVLTPLQQRLINESGIQQEKILGTQDNHGIAETIAKVLYGNENISDAEIDDFLNYEDGIRQIFLDYTGVDLSQYGSKEDKANAIREAAHSTGEVEAAQAQAARNAEIISKYKPNVGSAAEAYKKGMAYAEYEIGMKEEREQAQARDFAGSDLTVDSVIRAEREARRAERQKKRADRKAAKNGESTENSDESLDRKTDEEYTIPNNGQNFAEAFIENYMEKNKGATREEAIEAYNKRLADISGKSENTKGADANGGETVRSDSAERTDGVAERERVQGLQGGEGGLQQEADTGRGSTEAEDNGSDRQDLRDEEVTPKYGFIYTGDYSDEQKRFIADLKKDGFSKVTIAYGQLKNNKGQEIDAVVNGGDITVRWDRADVNQLANHERIHRWLSIVFRGKSAAERGAFIEKALSFIPKAELKTMYDVYFTSYSQAYAGEIAYYAKAYGEEAAAEYTKWIVYEEILCDAYAGRNYRGSSVAVYQLRTEEYIENSGLREQALEALGIRSEAETVTEAEEAFEDEDIPPDDYGEEDLPSLAELAAEEAEAPTTEESAVDETVVEATPAFDEAAERKAETAENPQSNEKTSQQDAEKQPAEKPKPKTPEEERKETVRKFVEKSNERAEQKKAAEEQSTEESTGSEAIKKLVSKQNWTEQRASSKEDKKENSNDIVAKLRSSISLIEKSQPVSELTGEEFSKGNKKLTEQVGEYFNSLGNSVFRKDFGDVVIDTRSVKSDISHGIGRAKSVTFAAVPNVIAKGTQIDFQKNWKGRGYDSYVFAAPVLLGGKTSYVAVVVLADNNKRFYLHEVVDSDGNIIFTKNTPPSDIKTGVTASSGVTGVAGSVIEGIPSVNSMPETTQNVNTNLSETNGMEAEPTDTAEKVPPKAETEKAKRELHKAVRMPIKGTNEEALLAGIRSGELSMDSVTLPKKARGFNGYQLETFVEALINGVYAKDNTIKVSVPYDGKFEIENTPENVTQILNELNVKVTQDIFFTQQLDSIFRKAASTVVTRLDGKAYLTDGKFIIPVTDAAAEYAISKDGYSAKVNNVKGFEKIINGDGMQIAYVPEESKSEKLLRLNADGKTIYFNTRYVKQMKGDSFDVSAWNGIYVLRAYKDGELAGAVLEMKPSAKARDGGVWLPTSIKGFQSKTKPTSGTGARYALSDTSEEAEPVKQNFTSADTSLAKNAPVLYKDRNAQFVSGGVNIDIGAGRTEWATNFLAEQGVRNLPFDPYNRPENTNQATLDFLMSGNKADTATCSNVLNVIDTEVARANVILEMAKAIKPDGKAYFTVYEKSGDGNAVQSGKDSWQNARKTKDYVSEIEQYFDKVTVKGKLIIAESPKPNLPKAVWETTPGKGVRYALSNPVELDYFKEAADLLQAVYDGKDTLQNVLRKLNEKYGKPEADRGAVYAQAASNVAQRTSPVSAAAAAGYRAQLDKLSQKYGSIKVGKDPARQITIPNRTEDGSYYRRFERTAMEAGAIPDRFLGKMERALVTEDFATYTRIGDKKTIREVDAKFNTPNGYQTQKNGWAALAADVRFPTKRDIAIGEKLLIEAVNNGDDAFALQVWADLCAMGTEAGQVVQAFSLMKKLGFSGKLHYVNSAVARLNNKGYNVKVDEKLVEAVVAAKTDAEQDEAMDVLIKSIAAQVPVTFADKWNAWRYLAMLGNPKTHARNFLGNVVMMPLRTMKDTFGAALESRFISDPSQRTKSARKDSGAIAFATQEFESNKGTITGNSKYSVFDSIMKERKVFKTDALNKLTEFNSKALDKEDKLFMRGAYIDAMARFLTARKVDVSKIDSRTLSEARNYAMSEAQKATFRDANVVAMWLNEGKSKNAFMNVALNAMVPFTTTPANILKRGIEYSPVGLIRGIANMAYGVKKGTVTATEAIDRLAAGMTGTMVAGLGVLLASLGILKGPDEDDKEGKLRKEEGEQGYSLVIGNTSFTIDWVVPVSMPLFVGVEAYKLFSDGERLNVNNVVNALSVLTEPMLSLSMLDGINDLLETNKYSDKLQIWSMIGSAITSYLSQGVPTLLGQLARTADPYRRMNYVDKNTDTNPAIQRFIQSVQGKIPVWSKSKAAYVDMWGRKDTGGGLAMRMFENFILPTYIEKVRVDALDRELIRLARETDNMSVLPEDAPKSFTVNEEHIELTAKQWEKYATTRGQTAHSLLLNIVNSEAYQNADDEARAVMVEYAFDYADVVAKSELFEDYEPKEKWLAKAQQDENIEDAILFRTLSKMVEEDDDKPNENEIIVATQSFSDVGRYKLLCQNESSVPTVTDKMKKGYEFKLTDEERKRFEQIFNEVFAQRYAVLLASARYMNADYEARAEMIAEAKNAAREDTRAQLANELRAAGRTSIAKK